MAGLQMLCASPTQYESASVCTTHKDLAAA